MGAPTLVTRLATTGALGWMSSLSIRPGSVLAARQASWQTWRPLKRASLASSMAQWRRVVSALTSTVEAVVASKHLRACWKGTRARYV